MLFVLVYTVLQAAPFSFLPTTVYQPDGTKIECFTSGDEYYARLHDKDGYTIVKNKKDNYFYYAKREAGKVIPSTIKIGSKLAARNELEKDITISKEEYRERFRKLVEARTGKKYSEADLIHAESHGISQHSHSKNAKKEEFGLATGTINNIALFIRFKGDTEFPKARQHYDDLLNSESQKSLKSFYKELSYGKLTINSTHYPQSGSTTNLSYEDEHPRAYYEPYDKDTNPIGHEPNEVDIQVRINKLIANAIKAVGDQVPKDINLDLDSDGSIDNLTIFIRGNAGGWSDLLWSHRAAMVHEKNIFINGKKAYDYIFLMENQAEVYALGHEFFHNIGDAPDLYHLMQSNVLKPCYMWDLMDFGRSHMSAYMKWKYTGGKWIDKIPEITTSGEYSLNPLTSSTNNAYKIKSPYSKDEFFVVEYRKKGGLFESNLPGSGLLVYRINSYYRGNEYGPPDEVNVYRPGGAIDKDGEIKDAFFSADVSRTELHDSSSPTTSYLSDGSKGGLNITNIGASGETISFKVTIPDSRIPIADFDTDLRQTVQTNSIAFKDLSTNNPTEWLWEFEGGTPATSTEQNPTITYHKVGGHAVKLTVKNQYGEDVEKKVGFIIITKLETPEAKFYPSESKIAVGGSTSINDQSKNTPTSWEWEFPGGTPATSTERYPFVKYDKEGIYDIKLTVSNKAGSDTHTNIGAISVGDVKNPPVSDFVVNNTHPNTNEIITFRNKATNNPIDYRWDFEGGYPSYSKLPNQGVVYYKEGIFKVSLIVSNEDGSDTNVKTEYIKVGVSDGNHPDAMFSSDKTVVKIGETIQYTDESTNSPTKWEWKFEGGTPYKSTEQNPKVVYKREGTYETILTVYNADGIATEKKKDYITVKADQQNEAPVADFIADMTEIKEREVVKFTDQSTNMPTSWMWRFEGGSPATSTDQNPSVTYNTEGSYKVTLTVKNSNGNNTETKASYITVKKSDSNNSCEGVAEWDSSVLYQVGDQMVYNSNLYEMRSNGNWSNLGPCENAKNIGEKFSLVVSPIPVENNLNIKLNPSKSSVYKIISVDGKILKSGGFKSSLYVGDLKRGVYILIINDQQKNMVSKARFLKK